MELVTAWTLSAGVNGSSYSKMGVRAMELSGKKVLIIAGPDFEDRELFYPLYRFQEAGANVKIAGIGEKQYKGKYGLPVEVHGQCEEFAKQRFDCVVIPGGWAPDKIRADEAAL